MVFIVLTVTFVALWAILAPPVAADTPSGYQEYFIPGSEDQLWDIFARMDSFDLVQGDGMHAVISVVAGSDGTTIYYDHWEDGYDFDPSDPSTADETVVLDQGEPRIFESAAIPIPRSAAQTHYDGRDRLYTAGGAVTVNRASWPESASTLFALAWEIYPTRPWMAQSTIPVGVDLADPSGFGYGDFEETHVIVQATEDGTQVEIDDPQGGVTTTTLNRGEVTQAYDVSAGTTVSASAPVQVQFIVGSDQGSRGHYEVRGYTAVPEDLWDDEYYVPVGSFYDEGESAYRYSDAYLHNPSATETLTVTWEEPSASGAFTIPPGGTLSYEDGRGDFLPQDAGVHLVGSHPFWGIASVDTESNYADWGYSLIPVSYLTNDYTIGWAPSTLQTDARGSFLFATAAQDDTVVFVDYDADEVVDDQFTLDRLAILRIDDTDDFDMTGAHIWANKPIAIVWGADPDVAEGGENYLDLGYTTLPFRDAWMDLVLTLDKAADPSFIPPDVGEGTTFTLVVTSHDLAVDDVDVVDALPADWAYVDDSTTITFPDGSQVTGDAADPGVSGQTLTWDLNHDLGAGEALTVAFEAVTTAVLATEYSLNQAHATGMRGTETWSAGGSALVYVSDLTLSKTSSAGGSGVRAGDTLTYTVSVTNTGSAPQHDLAITDPLPNGATYVADSCRLEGMRSVRDQFNNVLFGNNDGTMAWSGDWQEPEGDGPDLGVVQVLDGSGDSYALRAGYLLSILGGVDGGDGSAWRVADLSEAATATLSFEYRRSALEDGDVYYVEISSDGGSSWEVLGTLSDGPDDAYQSLSYDITAYLSHTTAVRFRSDFALHPSGWWGFDRDVVYVDNVQIRFPGTAPCGSPPALVPAADRYDLDPGEALAVTYQVTVDDPPPSGVSEIVNTASVTSDQLIEQITGSATEPLIPTAVRLASFAAEPRGSEILVTWETAMEIDNVGFHLHRAPAAGGPSTQLNEALIPAQHPGATFGARYQWVDRDVEPGVTYVYRLEDLDRSGMRTLHGPIQAALPLAASAEVHTTYLPLVVRGSGGQP